MNYQKIRRNPTQFVILTSLTIEEFDGLLPVFKRHWLKYNRYHTLEGKKRKLPNLNPGKPTRTLPSVEEKLFFLLSYLKNYPLQQFQAASFGISQAKVSQWVKVLHLLLQASLKELVPSALSFHAIILNIFDGFAKAFKLPVQGFG